MLENAAFLLYPCLYTCKNYNYIHTYINYCLIHILVLIYNYSEKWKLNIS